MVLGLDAFEFLNLCQKILSKKFKYLLISLVFVHDVFFDVTPLAIQVLVCFIFLDVFFLLSFLDVLLQYSLLLVVFHGDLYFVWLINLIF